ncbi:FYVE and coiled-coil domain-containing protein 1 isoform X1 [Carcharodon carcharias]|uniref:FYVE and coiled-coil domain-containing protein 1 isoform X1 n=1 Tax=Carcharodon carcharias TaxID=13397 RepID=UPI001B7E52AB|nr:FYVE and coiled-coil domain-containing protein 1 isoform X1 [Carcharodon carcharias]XP_041040267.1 FYVE and coiled-coil domain-containing protein 1 isoform X1 [Carcharodon carcharias]XP_041040268.1 FYVE and coiled-coil domain-containing protein 1 isoform X1 [Carcharodon carcharias]XP_041040270.1 FYVE and coiled-coil domain-containing protein 1 isoform X1 [Carcharodon carcharias]XP_041040271.1 FYVE and coiled-coil domain-containing protein 1 isoform X1 [Carcharodon carcharias]
MMAMSVGESQIQRIIRDLKDAISELNREHKENGEPITDDSTNLHKCCLKLEYLLQFDQKEKTTFLGNKKDYWDYFCNCLAKVKGANDGIRFVKSIPELKTSLGKGRAFIRYSLVHQRLADTIQQCLMNVKVTSDWYYARSPLLKSHLCSDIVDHLYELNEVQFDLASRGHDLDATWPTFARRSFSLSHSPSHLWKPPSRCSSISSLVSNYSQAPDCLSNPEINNPLIAEQLETFDELRAELDQSDVKQREMQEKIQQIELEKEELQKMITLHEQAAEAMKESTADTMEENRKLKQMLEELNQQSEGSVFAQDTVKELQKSLQTLEVNSTQKQQVLQMKIMELESCNQDYIVKLQSLTQEMERIRASEEIKDGNFSELQTKLMTVEKKNMELIARIDSILTEKGQLTATHYDSAQKIHELLDKLNEAEREEIGMQRLSCIQQSRLEKLTNDLKLRESLINELELKLKETTSNFEEKNAMLAKKDEELESTLNKLKEIESVQEKDTADLESGQNSVQELRKEQEETQTKYEKLKVTLEEQIDTLSSDLKAKELELSAAHNKAQNHQEVQNKLLSEKEELKKKLQDLEELLAKLQMRTEHINIEYQKLQTESKKQQRVMQKHIEREKELEETCLALETEIDRLNASEKQLQGQIADAKVTVDEKEAKLREDNRQLNEKLQNALRQFKRAETKLEKNQSEFDDLKLEENKLNDCLVNLQVYCQAKEELISDLQNKLVESKQNENSLISLLNEKGDALLEKVNTLKQFSENIEKSQATIKTLEEEKLNLENNFKQQTMLSESLIADKNAFVEAQLQKRELQEKEMQEINTKLVATKNQLETQQAEVTRLQAEGQELNSKLKHALAEKENICSNLNLAICSKEEYRTLVQNLKEQIESIISDHSEKVLLFKEKEDYFKNEREKSMQHIIELEEQLMSVKEELSQLKQYIEKIEVENVETKDLLHRANTEMAELGIQICTLSAEKADTEQKCIEISQQQTTFCEEVKTEQNQLNLNVSKLKSENEQLHEELRRLKQSATCVKELQKKLAQAQQQVGSFQEAAREELSAIKFQMSGEVMDYQNKLKTVGEELEAVRKHLNERQTQITSMDKQLLEFQARNCKLSEELEQKAQVIVDSQLLRNEKEEELKSLAENFNSTQQELEAVKMELEEYKQHIEKIQEETERNEQQLVAELADLNRTKEFLEERLIELIKDKDALWQKSDALEFEQKLRAEARWLGDREANYCLDCQSQFTWWLRRHHCRLCGRIFCYYCCNNFVMTKHNGKRERCCRACYTEHSAVVQRLNDLGSSSTPNSPDESPSRSASEGPISRNTESFTKPDDATFDIITDEELNEIDDNDCSSEIGNQLLATHSESTFPNVPSLSSTCDNASIDVSGVPPEDGSTQPMQDAEINLLKCGELTLKIPLKMDEIRQFGDNNRELFVKSSCYSLILIVVEECGLTISWIFSSDPKSISFSVVYQESEETPYEQCKVLIPLTRCNSHKETIQGQLKARNPGLYLLIFDNTFSRFTSKKVLYHLTVEKPIIYDGSDASEP